MADRTEEEHRVPLPRLGGRWRLLLGMVLANRPWLLVPGLKSALVAALATGAIATINSTVWVLAGSLSWWRLTVATIASTLAARRTGAGVTALAARGVAFRAAAPEVRLVALTSSSTAAAIQELLAAGIDSAISKSILTSDFAYVLRQSGRNTFFDSIPGTERPAVLNSRHRPRAAERSRLRLPKANAGWRRM